MNWRVFVVFFIFALECYTNSPVFSENASEPLAPDGLLTDLLDDTQTVFENGFPTCVTLENAQPEKQQWAEIRTLSPSFSWIVRDQSSNILQTSYEIQLAENALMNPVLWESGKRDSSESVSVRFSDDGPKLKEDAVYYWRVRTWNNGSESPWSAPKGFRTGKNIQEGEVSRSPIELHAETPASEKRISKENEHKTTFYDFGRAAFGRVRICVNSEQDTKIFVRLGERVKEGAVDRKPAGSTRYWQYELPIEAGTHTYEIATRRDVRNSSGAAFLVPSYIGEVMPFRYAEIEETDASVEILSFERLSAYYHFDDSAAFFHSSDETLNEVWNLCKYSIKATSFLGVYIDGDRERIPYEGDALLNQLSHYGVDREYSMARFSWEYLIFHPTWPTEWNLQCCQMAWYDYLYTGDSRGVERLYNDLKTKSLIALSDENGLISTRNGKVTPEVLAALHIQRGTSFRDIVDWPHKGLAGNENAESGETDGFVFKKYNAVVNAYHFFALNSMLKFAQILGKTEDAAFFASRIETVRKSFQQVFFDEKRGVYRDGETTDHASLHGNMFPLAFGLVPEEHRKSVTEFVESRGMRCSVYGAQFLLDAVYNGENGAYGLDLLRSRDVRSWYNMIRAGSTISLEAWDDRYKPNQDWNHAWGAAPANIIPRKLAGVEPIAPGCSRLRIHPQPANLAFFDADVPTIRGNVHISWRTSSAELPGLLTVEIPANVTADVYVPTSSGFRLETVGSGRHEFEVK